MRAHPGGSAARSTGGVTPSSTSGVVACALTARRSHRSMGASLYAVPVAVTQFTVVAGVAAVAGPARTPIRSAPRAVADTK